MTRALSSSLSRLRLSTYFVPSVGHAVLPTSPHNALPFEGQVAEGGVAAFAALKLHLVITLGPDTKGKRGACRFVKCLAQELGTSPAHVNPNASTTGLLDRGNATKGSPVGSAAHAGTPAMSGQVTQLNTATWTTDSDAVLTTNLINSSYRFSVTNNSNRQFYRV